MWPTRGPAGSPRRDLLLPPGPKSLDRGNHFLLLSGMSDQNLGMRSGFDHRDEIAFGQVFGECDCFRLGPVEPVTLRHGSRGVDHEYRVRAQQGPLAEERPGQGKGE